MAIKKYEDVTKHIADNVRKTSEGDGKLKFQVTQEAYTNFMKNRGLTEDTIKQVRDAQADYNNGSIAFMRDTLLAEPEIDQVTVNTRTGSGVISARMTRQVLTRTPGTDDRNDKFGVVSLKLNLKTRMDKDLLAECSEDIAKGMK